MCFKTGPSTGFLKPCIVEKYQGADPQIHMHLKIRSTCMFKNSTMKGKKINKLFDIALSGACFQTVSQVY